MYRRPNFLTVRHKIREAMSGEGDYDVDLFTEMVRSGSQPARGPRRNIRGFVKHAPRNEEGEFELNYTEGSAERKRKTS